MGFNRNIITPADAAEVRAAASLRDIPAVWSANPPAGYVPALLALDGGAPPPTTARETAVPAVGGAGDLPVPTEDNYVTKLLKYIPLELVGAYLFAAGLIDSNVTATRAHALWLGGLLVVVMAVAVPYDWQVLGVRRYGQIAMSVVGLGVYVFALGGWFATTTWYEHWYASLALPAYALLVGMVKLKPLSAVNPAA